MKRIKKIGVKGRIILPKPMREVLKLVEGDAIFLELQGKTVKITKKEN